MKQFFILSLYLFICISVHAQQISKADEQLVDSIMKANYNEQEPGAVILIAKNGQPLYRKAYGLASLELNTSNKPENVFQIASISKQFTAVCILQLAQEGKLNLKDDIRKYILTYNSHGRTISIENLLYQTSGIPSFTELRHYELNRTIHQTKEELLNSFMNDSLLFEPGTDWSYSNSNYALAALIVEKVSGLSLGAYYKQYIFDPLQMQHSCLETTDTIISNKANGYTSGNYAGYKPAAIEECSWNIGSSGICTTVDDLLKWDNALYTEKILKQEWLSTAWKAFTLPDGRSTNYGFGWGLCNYKGLQIIEHGGAAFGFLSTALRVPSQQLYIVILSNNEASNPYSIGEKLIMHFAGQVLVTSPKLYVDKKQLSQYTGVYQIHRIGARVATNFTNEQLFRSITIQNDTLYSQSPGGFKEILTCIGKDLFRFENNIRLRFNRSKTGAIESLETWFEPLSRGLTELEVKTTLPFPKEKIAISIDEKVLKSYAGKYDTGQGYFMEIGASGNSLFILGTGSDKEELFAENETTFFLKSRDANITFTKVNGKVTGLVLNEGMKTIGKKMD